MEERIHVIVRGQVQGVFYRSTAKDVAVSLGITGWVKNMPDGSVEIMASGYKEKLDKFIAWCYEGPKNARVENVTITKAGAAVERDFRIIK